MSRASISTGGIQFTKQDKPTDAPKPKPEGSPFHVAIIGDFSGRLSRGEQSAHDLAERRAIEIDRDNFEEVFEQLAPSLTLPFCDEPIRFQDIDDLHPDYIYPRVDLFDKFRQLTRKLKNKDSFEQAAEEILSWSEQAPEATEESDTQDDAPEGIPMPDNMLDAVLAQTTPSAPTASSDSFDANQLIKSIVAPYAKAKDDPRLPELLEAVETASAETMRKLLHARAFQTLEANWRGLYTLIRRIETDSRLKLFIFDISPDELRDDAINHEDTQDSQLYKLLVEQRKVPGATEFSIIQCNTYITDDIDDVCLAALLGHVAHDCGGTAVVGGDTRLAGCESLNDTPDSADWDYEVDPAVITAWQAFRNTNEAQRLCLAAPRFLLRLPYGKRSAPIESFDFEELGDPIHHENYCWGNSAHILTLLAAEHYTQFGHTDALGKIQDISELPIHIRYDQGHAQSQACAEIFMTDSAAGSLIEAGFTPVRSIKDSGSVRVVSFIPTRVPTGVSS